MLEPIAIFGRPGAWRRILLATLAALLVHAVADAQGPPARAQVSAQASQARVAPGGQLAIAVVIDFDPSWHAWPAEAQLDLLPEAFQAFVIPTEIGLDSVPAWLSAVGEAQLPDTHAAPVPNLAGDGPAVIEVQTYSDRAVAYIPVLLDENAPLGPATLTARVFYQACDETTCMPPVVATAEIPIEIVPLESAGGEPADADLFAGFDATAYAGLEAGRIAQRDGGRGASAPTTAPGRKFFGIPVPAADGVAGVVVLALLSALGGFILNLTPCVLPVIPIKVLTISQHAGSPGRSLVLGLAMAVGVVAFWVGIGVPVAFFAGVTDPSRIFGIWWVTLGIGLVIGLMGVGIMGLFSINLPQQVYMVNPKADSLGGSFLFGVMTAVLGLPCFGFVAGALLAGAATLPPAVIMVIFGSLGVGMAAPYLVLSAKPSLVERIPRTGPASELVKQVMGLLLLAAAAYFVGSGALGWLSEHPDLGKSLPWWSKAVHWWLVAMFAALAGLWLLIRTFQITPKPGRRVAFTVVALLLGGAAVAYAADTTRRLADNIWTPFDEAELVAAQERGQVVVVDFTAEWCLNCKALKAAVLERQPVKGELLKPGVVPMVADLTSTKAPGWDKLRDLGQTGIPLLVIYGPGLEEPWQSNAYTSQQVLDALARARGEAGTVAASR
jgi:thiol:disulfide interchange protein